MVGDDEGERISRGAEDLADLAHRFDRVENIDREGITEHHDENVTSRDRLSCRDGGEFEIWVGPGVTDQARPRRLVKSDAELDFRHRLHDRLVQILDGLDEMRLP